ELVERVKVQLTAVDLVMHGHDGTRLDQADDLSGLGAVQRAAAADRHEEHVYRAELLNPRLAGYMVEIAEMRDGKAPEVVDEDDVAPNLVGREVRVVRLHAG